MRVATEKRVFKSWKKEELNYIKEHYHHTSNKYLAIKFNCTVSAIKCIASRFKLNKSHYTRMVKKTSIENGVITATIVKECKLNKHADMIKFANTLEEGVTYRTLMLVFNKYGFYKFQTMYQLYTA